MFVVDEIINTSIAWRPATNGGKMLYTFWFLNLYKPASNAAPDADIVIIAFTPPLYLF